MNKNLFYYELPESLIAQQPAARRDGSRLMVLHRDTGLIEHRQFHEITEYFKAGDLLVLNDSRVIHARLFGVKRGSGAAVEIFLIHAAVGTSVIWEVLAKPAKRLRTGDIVDFSEDFAAEILSNTEDGGRVLRFFQKHADGTENETSFDLTGKFDALGKMPLPPYIKRQANADDEIRYQTVYAKMPGSVAAPTAGLHFTDEILNALREKGVEIAFVTLHVGIGTFRPVKTDEIEEHHMHSESYVINTRTAELLNRAKSEGRRVICVGTTSVRTLESAASVAGAGISHDARAASAECGACVDTQSRAIFSPCARETNIFIYPGYRFRAADAMLTNFHLPESTLLMLISAFAGRERVLEAYEEAVREGYRFFSYGDAMLIL